jgi:hypothetical protein
VPLPPLPLNLCTHTDYAGGDGRPGLFGWVGGGPPHDAAAAAAAEGLGEGAADGSSVSRLVDLTAYDDGHKWRK